MHDLPKGTVVQWWSSFCFILLPGAQTTRWYYRFLLTAVLSFLFLYYNLQIIILSHHFFFRLWSCHQLEFLKRCDYKNNHRQIPASKVKCISSIFILPCLGIKPIASTVSIIQTCLTNGSIMWWQSDKYSWFIPWKLRTCFLHFSFIKQLR